MHELTSDRRILSQLYQDYDWNELAEAVLDGSMGRAWADRAEKPRLGVLEYPLIHLYLVAGDPTLPESRDFLSHLPVPSALVFTAKDWEDILKQVHQKKILEHTRYAFSSENLDQHHLQELASRVPTGYLLQQMHLKQARQLAEEKSRFSEDHFLNFDSLDQFINQGFGFCILHNGAIVCAATTFVISKRGIEIQINTREEHRRKGLATVVAASLMLHSLQKGLEPSWDAANKISASLAEKLGYIPQGTYTMYVVTDDDE